MSFIDPEIYNRLALLAQPGQAPADGFFWPDVEKEVLRRNQYSQLASLVLHQLGNLGEVRTSLAELFETVIKPVTPPANQPVGFEVVPINAWVRLGFKELGEAVDLRYGGVHNDLVRGAAHLGIFTVAYAHQQIIRNSGQGQRSA